MINLEQLFDKLDHAINFRFQSLGLFCQDHPASPLNKQIIFKNTPQLL
ncbi:hypothetical protein PRJ_5709 (plasmid) [Pseudomonas sp. XWY-1]|nr:hypothetical protein PRJ_5709 [Pseudomonas sp. XWY-1]